MKKIIGKIALFVLLSFPLYVNGQTKAMGEISTLLQKGDAAGFDSYLGEQVLLNILEEEVQADKKTALNALKDFFTINPPQNFSHKHNGQSKDGNVFAIGAYKTKDTELRTYYVLKDGKIRELCIEME